MDGYRLEMICEMEEIEKDLRQRRESELKDLQQKHESELDAKLKDLVKEVELQKIVALPSSWNFYSAMLSPRAQRPK